MWSKWKHMIPLILAVLLALTPAAAAQDIWIPETNPTKAPDDFSDYTTTTVQRGSVCYDYVTSSAVDSYPHTQNVLCAHSGTLLREYLVARGDTVKKGDIVAYLYRPCSQTDLARMKLNLQRSEEAMQSGISQRQAQIRQLEDQAAAETDSREKEILRLTVEYKKTELELFRYEQQRAIDSQKEKIAYYDPIPVIASMDGTVSNLKAKPEEPVSRDALLLTIQDDSVWYLRLKRNSTDYVYHLPLTVEASVKGTDGKADMIYELTGKLITASNVVPKSASNTDGGTFYFMLDPGQTMPENVSYYSICGSLRQLDDVLYLPESAFLNRNHHHAYVQVVLPDGSTEQRLVTLGFNDAFYNHMSVTGITRYYWVVDGVSEGETVILWE